MSPNSLAIADWDRARSANLGPPLRPRQPRLKARSYVKSDLMLVWIGGPAFDRGHPPVCVVASF
jgi:hypothetical protein